MQASRVPAPRSDRRAASALLSSVAIGAAGLAWLAIAAVSAWIVFATPALARLASLDPRDAAQPFVGAVAWALGLTAPACFAVLGVARLARAANRARHAGPPLPPVTRAARRLPPGCTVYPAIRLPDGGRIPDVVVGPHGIALFERLPPPAAVRRTGDRWEVRFADGSWRPYENPLARAARDGERLKRHLESEEHDFVVRVHAAVLGDPSAVERTDPCAVVALADVPGWLAALPAQRGLTPDRQARLHEVLAGLV